MFNPEFLTTDNNEGQAGNSLIQYLQEQSPDTLQRVAKSASGEIQDIIRHNVQGLLGMLPGEVPIFQDGQLAAFAARIYSKHDRVGDAGAARARCAAREQQRRPLDHPVFWAALALSTASFRALPRRQP